MNSRKSATEVTNTVTRYLKSGFLKTPPPSYYPQLLHSAQPSLVQQLPDRSKAADTPSGSRPAKRRSHAKRSRPDPIVFPEDRIRQQFFRDHPMEAYRPAYLLESTSKVAQEQPGPKGEEWTALRQRTLNPSPEDAIAFTLHLQTVHALPSRQAYLTAIAQFRTLRSEHANATRAATLQARAFGGQFYSEIERGIAAEDRVLDTWADSREIKKAYDAQYAMPGSESSATAAAKSEIKGLYGAPLQNTTPGAQGIDGLAGEDATDEFSGGAAYLRRIKELVAEPVRPAEPVKTESSQSTP